MWEETARIPRPAPERGLTQHAYPGQGTVTYSYENATSRLHSVLDALGQTKDYSYTEDSRLSSITYLNAVDPTANVSFAYDPYFPRLVSMTDGTGTTSWSYLPVGTLGALDLAKEAGPLPNSTIAYGYDPLGRVASRVVGKAGETLAYDAIGRLAQDTNPLGTFTISYLGETAQPTEREVNGGNPITWGYLDNTGDRRLASIDNDNQVQYQLTTMPENLVTGVSVTRATAYPATGTETASYNNLNQLTNLSGQALTYDADGNLLSDSTRDYTWDAENRLIGITFPAAPGEKVAFTYDGLGRRVEITTTPAGGNPTTTSYTWCGLRPCIASNSDGSVARRYYAEGEQVLSPATGLYYGQDQIGSTRDVLVMPGSTTQTYNYDPYGNALATPGTGPLTDFRFAGMFFEPSSGLYLTRTRAYDPAIARWLSRDPLGEASDPLGNLYRYVYGNPVTFADPSGLWTFQIGGSLTFQFGPIAIAFSAGVAVDTSGNIGTYYATPLGGIGTGEALSGGISFAASSAPTICNLSGPFTNAAIGGGVGPNASADLFFGSSPNGRAMGGAGVTFGVGVGGGGSVTVTSTAIHPF